MKSTRPTPTLSAVGWTNYVYAKKKLLRHLKTFGLVVHCGMSFVNGIATLAVLIARRKPSRISPFS